MCEFFIQNAFSLLLMAFCRVNRTKMKCTIASESSCVTLKLAEGQDTFLDNELLGNSGLVTAGRPLSFLDLKGATASSNGSLQIGC